MRTIQEFKDCGAKIKVAHSRFYAFEDGVKLVECRLLEAIKQQGTYDPKKLSCRGGKTEVQISLMDGTELSGEALCNQLDNFCYRTGFVKAFGRAIAPFVRQTKLDLRKSKLLEKE